MLTTGRTRPPPPRLRPRVEPGATSGRAPGKPRPRRRASYERVLGIALVVSVGLHLLFLLLVPAPRPLPFADGGLPADEAAPAISTIAQLVIPVVSENAPDDPPPVEREEVDRPIPLFVQPPPAARPGVAPAQPPAPSEAAPGRPGSAREALQPGFRDPRLYVNPNQIRPDSRSDHERYMEHLHARIEAMNDSMYGGRDPTDWTRTDSEGRRWGLSPDGLHLGGVTVPRALLPLPAATGDNARLMEERERARQREEIQRQEADRERRQTQEERNRAIRERQESQRPGGGGG